MKRFFALFFLLLVPLLPCNAATFTTVAPYPQNTQTTWSLSAEFLVIKLDSSLDAFWKAAILDSIPEDVRPTSEPKRLFVFEELEASASGGIEFTVNLLSGKTQTYQFRPPMVCTTLSGNSVRAERTLFKVTYTMSWADAAFPFTADVGSNVCEMRQFASVAVSQTINLGDVTKLSWLPPLTPESYWRAQIPEASSRTMRLYGSLGSELSHEEVLDPQGRNLLFSAWPKGTGLTGGTVNFIDSSGRYGRKAWGTPASAKTWRPYE